MSSPMQVSTFFLSQTYSFSGVCDHWLVAPSTAANGVDFYVIVNFFEEDLRIGRVFIKYGGLELVSTSEGEAESNVSPIDDSTPGVYIFAGNVVVTRIDGVNTIYIRAIGVIVTHTYSPQDLESVEVKINNTASLPNARGLCGTVDGRLQFSGDTNEVADVTNMAQLQRFSRSWIVPADLQTSTVESCSKPYILQLLMYMLVMLHYTIACNGYYLHIFLSIMLSFTSLIFLYSHYLLSYSLGALQTNDSIIADPQFSVSTSDNISEALCYEVHGAVGKYFNLISDTCISVNALFTSMPSQGSGNRMSTIGVHAVQTEEPVILGGNGGSKCVDIRIELQNCAAFVNGEPLPDEGAFGQVQFQKNYHQWILKMYNCDKEKVEMIITCQTDMLRLDVMRNTRVNATAHGLMGKLPYCPVKFCHVGCPHYQTW